VPVVTFKEVFENAKFLIETELGLLVLMLVLLLLQAKIVILIINALSTSPKMVSFFIAKLFYSTNLHGYPCNKMLISVSP